MKTTRIAIVAAVIAGAAVELASPVSAEPLDGSYTETLNEPDMMHLGSQDTASPCGPDCIHLQRNGPTASLDLHPQSGDIWTGTHATSQPDVNCTTTLNMKSLVLVDACGGMRVFHSQLTKNG